MKKIIVLLMLIPSLCLADTTWEDVKSGRSWVDMARTPVPHGWLVRTVISGISVSTIFMPDENHEWKL